MHTHKRFALSNRSAAALRYVLALFFVTSAVTLRAQFSKSDESVSNSIYTVIVNTSWNDRSFSKFTIGLLDADTSLYSLMQRKFKGVKIHGKNVVIKRFANQSSLEKSQVLYVDGKFNRYVEKIFGSIGNGTLLITNSSGKKKFNMVDFKGRLNKEDFSANRENIENAGMTLSERFTNFGSSGLPDVQTLPAGSGKGRPSIQPGSIQPRSVRTDYGDLSIEEKVLMLNKNSDILREQAEQIAEQEKLLADQKRSIAEQQRKIGEQQKVLNDQLAEIGAQRTVLWLLIAVLLLIGVTAYLFYNSYRSKKKTVGKLAEQNQVISEQKLQNEKILHELRDSIHYAYRIQNAVLPAPQLISKSIPGDYFVMYEPKDIVSGDFFFVDHREDWTLVAVADCTGHGVPGAFVSMLCISLLNEIVRQQEDLKANVILNELRDKVIGALQQRGVPGEQMDGMDISLLLFNVKTRKAQWAGANNPLYLVSQDGFSELKPDKRPISIYPDMQDFTNHELQLQKGDRLYLFTDGYADQFGGSKGKKFMSRSFRKLIADNAHRPMKEQSEIFTSTLHSWKNADGRKYEQIDDITLLGIKID
jgi:serine phosphatase RsbU (regulator of sigma subunit)